MILVRGQWLNRSQVMTISVTQSGDYWVRFTLPGNVSVLSDESYATQAEAEAAAAVYATGDRP